MTLVHDQLHASIFGRHFHSCPSERCKGAERPCSDPYDCQPVPKLCATCADMDDDMREQRSEWRKVDRLFQTAVGGGVE